MPETELHMKDHTVNSKSPKLYISQVQHDLLEYISYALGLHTWTQAAHQAINDFISQHENLVYSYHKLKQTKSSSSNKQGK